MTDAGAKLADSVAEFVGSWRFIIIQTTFVVVWLVANVVGFFWHWDEYPFIALNLLFSVQAAYTAPVIMMSQNRQAERDRKRVEADAETNLCSKSEIESLQKDLSRIENEKLDRLLSLVDAAREARSKHAATAANKRWHP